MRQLVPAYEVRNESIVLNSRFIASLSPVFTVQEAKAFIKRIRNEFHDATHNVPAYLIGHGNSVNAHCNDDGEPSGTAGKPVLAVLSGSGLGDVAVVVTRYYGGKKLGTGGLVRAYSEAVKGVVDIAPRAVKISTYTIMMDVSYPIYERVHSGVIEFQGDIVEEAFGSEVTITARFPVNRFPKFETYVRELSRGELKILVIEEKESIMPLSKNSDKGGR